MPDRPVPRDVAMAWLRYFERARAATGWPADEGKQYPEGDPDEWASGYIVDLTFSDPHALWPITTELVSMAESPEALATIGAGPLEDLLNWTGDTYVDEIGRLIESEVRWAFAVRCTYTRRMSGRARDLVEHLIEKYPSEDELAAVVAALGGHHPT